MDLPGHQWAVFDHGYSHWTWSQPVDWHPAWPQICLLTVNSPGDTHSCLNKSQVCLLASLGHCGAGPWLVRPLHCQLCYCTQLMATLHSGSNQPWHSLLMQDFAAMSVLVCPISCRRCWIGLVTTRSVLLLWEESSCQWYEEQQEMHKTGRMGQGVRLMSGHSGHPGLFAGTTGVHFHL